MSIDVQCPDCRKRYRVKDSLVGKTLKCKQCSADMPVSDEFGTEEDWGGDDAESTPQLPATKRRKSGSAKKATKSGGPSIGKRIFAVIGMVLGVVIVIAAGVAVAGGNMRGIRGIVTGCVIAGVSFGWFRGTSD